jgi:micrococcal nuclease
LEASKDRRPPMIRRTLSTLFLTFLFLAAASTQATNLFTVTRVADGDTVTCEGYGITFKVRLAGIDTPEKGSKKRPGQPYAEQARNYLQSLILDKQITIEQVGLDGFNRVLGVIYVNGLNVNLEMVKRGYAEVYRGKHKVDIRPYWEAEKEAKAKKLHIWSRDEYVSPKEWRKQYR